MQNWQIVLLCLDNQHGYHDNATYKKHIFFSRSGDGRPLQASVGGNSDPRLLCPRSGLPGGGGVLVERLAVHQPRCGRAVCVLSVLLVVIKHTNVRLCITKFVLPIIVTFYISYLHTDDIL